MQQLGVCTSDTETFNFGGLPADNSDIARGYMQGFGKRADKFRISRAIHLASVQ